ncbi:MAG: carbohydrate binding family 9 domain-containing protein [Micropepsaceae bacterium]
MNAKFFAQLAGASASVLLSVTLASAADPVPARDFSTYQPTAPATRIQPSEAPKIDANLSDAAWANARVISDFYQLEPNEKQPASERMEVRVLYDENNIYFAFHVYDSEPDKITASIKSRDGNLSSNDLIRIYLDPYKTRRDGYLFEVNPLGARFDGLLQNNSDILGEWDTIWHAQARIVEDGWIAEVAIPFRSISYDAASNDWGFDIFRLIRRKGERIRWSQIDNQRSSRDISRSGNLTGIANTAQGLGLDLQPFLAARYKHEWRTPREDDVTLEPSGNIFYKITPSLTGTLTFNTDFSDAPLDSRQINTGRFGLFFPETRDFFLQDAAVFEFGGNNLNNDVNGIPFFSRNIGLVNGTPVDIVAGGKLSGQLGNLGIGALIVDTAGTETTDNQILSAARFTMPVLEESKLGIVFTNGDPTGATENTVGGADFQFRNATWFDGKQIQADFFYERSFSSAFGDDDAFGTQLSFPNEPLGARFQFKEVGANFSPALGFVNRPGIRSYDGNFYWFERPKDSWIRTWNLGTFYNFVTDLNDHLETRENGVFFELQTQDTDMFEIVLFNNLEDIPFSFFLPRGVLIPAGEYEWNAAVINVNTSIGRPVSGGISIRCCDWFGGRRFGASTYVNWRPDTTWEIGANHQFIAIALATGDVEIQVYGLNVGLNFTPDMQLRTQIQYDNISQAFGLSARYRWEFEPGSELFASLGESGDLIDGRHYTSSTTQMSVRIGQLMRF